MQAECKQSSTSHPGARPCHLGRKNPSAQAPPDPLDKSQRQTSAQRFCSALTVLKPANPGSVHSPAPGSPDDSRSLSANPGQGILSHQQEMKVTQHCKHKAMRAHTLIRPSPMLEGTMLNLSGLKVNLPQCHHVAAA